MTPLPSHIQSGLTLLLLACFCLHWGHGFMSNEFSSTRYFTDKGFLPPLQGLTLRPSGMSVVWNQTTADSFTTDTSSVLSLDGSSSVPVTYTNNPKSVYRWLSDNLPYEGCTIGFDVEVSILHYVFCYVRRNKPFEIVKNDPSKNTSHEDC